MLQVTEFAGSNDAILLVALPAQAAPGVANTRVLRFAQELDPDGKPARPTLMQVTSSGQLRCFYIAYSYSPCSAGCALPACIPLLPYCLSPDAALPCLAGSRTVGVLTRVDQAAGDARALSATSALLQGQGPGLSREIPWVATVTKAQADVSADESLAGSFQAELDMLRNILGRGSQLRLGRTALIEALFATIRNRTKQKIPTLLAG